MPLPLPLPLAATRTPETMPFSFPLLQLPAPHHSPIFVLFDTNNGADLSVETLCEDAEDVSPPLLCSTLSPNLTSAPLLLPASQ